MRRRTNANNQNNTVTIAHTFHDGKVMAIKKQKVS